MRYLICFCLLPIFTLAQKHNPNKELPNIAIYDSCGEAHNLKQLANNKITIIEFWFLGCYPCMLKMKYLQDLYLRHKPDSTILFLTISRTDSSNIIPIQRHDVGSNYYKMYKAPFTPDTLLLPVYYLKDCGEKNIFTISKDADTAGNRKISIKVTPPLDKKSCPEVVFEFSAYPTLLIYDKIGNLIYYKTGFKTSYEPKETETIEKLLKIYSNP